MMTDTTVTALALALEAGDLHSAVPLMDRLHETGDPRWRDVAAHLLKLREGLSDGTAQWKDNFSEVVASSAPGAEAAEQVRRQHSRMHRKACWNAFKRRLRVPFAIELTGAPDLQAVRALAAELDFASLPSDEDYFRELYGDREEDPSEGEDTAGGGGDAGRMAALAHEIADATVPNPAGAGRRPPPR